MIVRSSQKPIVFAVIIVSAAVALWGWRGVIKMLPGPDY